MMGDPELSSPANDNGHPDLPGFGSLDWFTSQPWWGEVHDELRNLAAALLVRERPGHTLQPTALLNEAYLRLAKHRKGWSGRLEFFAAAASTLRHVLVDHARGKKAGKRFPAERRVTMETSALSYSPVQLDLIDLDEALTKLEAIEPKLAKIVDIRFFGGLTEEEAAQVLGVAPRTVQLHWRAAKAWLRQALETVD